VGWQEPKPPSRRLRLSVFTVVAVWLTVIVLAIAAVVWQLIGATSAPILINPNPNPSPGQTITSGGAGWAEPG